QRKVQRYVEIGRKEGAHLRCGGGQPKDPALAKGFYFEPTVFTEVDNKMQIAQEEIFGPVASILKFHDEDDAVRIGNDVIYGLAAGVQTKDLKRAHRLAKRLQAGTVWINTWHMIEANSPFGGYKPSGYGRENGIAMVEHLTKLKQVWVDLNDLPWTSSACESDACLRRLDPAGASSPRAGARRRGVGRGPARVHDQRGL